MQPEYSNVLEISIPLWSINWPMRHLPEWRQGERFQTREDVFNSGKFVDQSYLYEALQQIGKRSDSQDARRQENSAGRFLEF